jgi:hypothetical protein
VCVSVGVILYCCFCIALFGLEREWDSKVCLFEGVRDNKCHCYLDSCNWVIPLLVGDICF